MPIAAILAAIQMVGSETPAFIALFNEVKPLFGDDDQATLQKAYDDAMKASDKAHDDFQKS